MKELFYPSTYHAMKAGPCRVGVCKYDGECGKCKEYGALRRYAARETDRIQELRALVKELEDALTTCMRDELDGCATRSEREEVNKHRKEYRALVAKAREVIGGAE